jgi:hypothetical protein
MKSSKIAPPVLGKTYRILFIVNDKGGSRKSTLLIFIIAILVMAKMRVQAYEIDDQGRVARLYKEMVKTLVLPDADSLSKTSLGDTAILAPMLEALTEAADQRTIAIEVGANLAERVAFALKTNFVSKMIPDDTPIAILTPIDPSDDSIALAARSARLINNALPQAEIIVVQPREHLGLNLGASGLSAVAKEGFKDVLEPALRRNGPLVWPLMTPDVRHAFETMRVNPVELLAADILKLGEAGYDPGRMMFERSPESLSWMGRRLKTEFQMYLASLMLETRRMLGFPNDVE